MGALGKVLEAERPPPPGWARTQAAAGLNRPVYSSASPAMSAGRTLIIFRPRSSSSPLSVRTPL